MHAMRFLLVLVFVASCVWLFLFNITIISLTTNNASISLMISAIYVNHVA